jgi:uncharacterized protein YecT (DUF1311 family)
VKCLIAWVPNLRVKMLGLMKIYKRLMAKLSAKRKEALLEAQRAWIKFRDANCNFYYDPEGGSAAHLAGTDCNLNATANRATELRNLSTDE